MTPIFANHDPFRESENKKRVGQVRRALWFAGNGKAESIVLHRSGNGRALVGSLTQSGTGRELRLRTNR
jgi:hypothetical protein